MIDWQPIETAPKDGTEILLGLKDGWDGAPYYSQGSVSSAYWENGHWFTNGGIDDDIIEFTPTHWKTLPCPPSMEVQGTIKLTSIKNWIPSRDVNVMLENIRLGLVSP